MISSGSPVNEYIDSAVRHVLLRQVSASLLLLVNPTVCYYAYSIAAGRTSAYIACNVSFSIISWWQ
jgi:hypothetical protein